MKRIVLTLCKHFPINHSFRQVFNLNTIKLSFSSMVNMTNLIKQHNARILKNEEHTKKEVKNMECKECKKYFGAAEGEFKLCYNNHAMSFRH